MITLLQLNTRFPRILGDVGCAETFSCPLEIIKVEAASVANVVNADTSQVPLAAFENAIAQASGDLITTSCGFLSCHQQHLASKTPTPFLSSALLELPRAIEIYGFESVAILTFDKSSLGANHFAGLLPQQFDWQRLNIIGLPTACHLRHVIENDEPNLDADLAEIELISLLELKFQTHKPACLLLECTNLPPYKHAIQARFDVPVLDILTAIERVRPQTVKPEFVGM